MQNGEKKAKSVTTDFAFFRNRIPMRLPFHHLPYADDAAIADQFDQVNAGGIG